MNWNTSIYVRVCYRVQQLRTLADGLYHFLYRPTESPVSLKSTVFLHRLPESVR